jgi:hypothetical protein
VSLPVAWLPARASCRRALRATRPATAARSAKPASSAVLGDLLLGLARAGAQRAGELMARRRVARRRSRTLVRGGTVGGMDAPDGVGQRGDRAGQQP